MIPASQPATKRAPIGRERNNDSGGGLHDPDGQHLVGWRWRPARPVESAMRRPSAVPVKMSNEQDHAEPTCPARPRQHQAGNEESGGPE
jgi:hypothetical protein